MPYPIAPPQLKISWDNEVSFESSAISQRFDGGADFRNTRGQLNQMLRSRSITANLNYQDYLIVEEFLAANVGKPFYFDETLYICEEYTWSILSYIPSVFAGNQQLKPTTGLFKLDTSLKEIIRPVIPPFTFLPVNWNEEQIVWDEEIVAWIHPTDPGVPLDVVWSKDPLLWGDIPASW